MFSGNRQILGFIVFFGAYLISRVINERNLKRLSGEEKARVVDGFSNYRIYKLAAVVVLVFGFMLVSSAFPRIGSTLAAIYFALLFLTVIVSSIIIHKTLRRLNLPDGYVKTFWLSSLLQYFGILFLFAIILSSYFL